MCVCVCGWGGGRCGGGPSILTSTRQRRNPRGRCHHGPPRDKWAILRQQARTHALSLVRERRGREQNRQGPRRETKTRLSSRLLRAAVSQTLWQPALARRSPPDHRRPGSLPQPIHARVVPLVKALQLTPLVGAVCCPARVRHDPVARQVLRSLCAGEGELRPVGEAAGVAWTRQWAGVGRRCSALGRRERWSFKKARQLRLNRD